MPDGLLRITAVSGGRRSDLAVPAGVAVAELVPDLARAVGLLDPAAVYAGYRLVAHGRRLQPDRGLREQGVQDGALLVVAAGVDDPAPAVHDDLVDATVEVVRQQPSWQSADTRRTTLAAGLAVLAMGTVVLALDLISRASVGWSLPGTGWEPDVAAAVVLTLVVLAGNALPALAVTAGVARAESSPVDAERVAAMVARSARLLLVGSAGVGLVAVLTAPVVADGPAGAALAADCCLVLLLRARRSRGRAQVLTDVAGGIGGLLTTAVALLARHPDARVTLAVALAGCGLAVVVATRFPAAPGALRARALDLLETLALVALAPLLLAAADGLTRLGW